MIVMKFGGSSLASATAIRRVAFLVRSEMHRNAAVVVSAFGKTTDQLMGILNEAKHGRAYLGWTIQKELMDYHFGLVDELLSGPVAEQTEQYLRSLFRDLHVLTLDIAENGHEVTPEVTDQVLSLGEQLSSKMVAAAFNRSGVASVHLDARKLIVTDDHFTKAVPREWETYANLRSALPDASSGPVAVLGGFIGATEDGRTTTLGRGGSDLSASLVGAALHAEEIQIWTDVDGILTCDPRLKRDVYRLNSLSYQEAAELARSGARVLHPDTIEPAKRSNIPVVVRNSIHPSTRETRIVSRTQTCSTPVKSIAARTNITLLEIRSMDADASAAGCSHIISEFCRRYGVASELIAMSDDVLYLAVNSDADIHRLNFSLDQGVNVHVRPRQAILSLVGNIQESVVARVRALLVGIPTVVLPRDPESIALRLAVSGKDVGKCIDILHDHFFRKPDRQVFARHTPTAEAMDVTRIERPEATESGPVNFPYKTRLA